jgi:hypothetical protein
MNLLYILPVVILVVVAILIFGRRSRRDPSGLGDRRDSEERPELRGTTQWKERQH